MMTLSKAKMAGKHRIVAAEMLALMAGQAEEKWLMVADVVTPMLMNTDMPMPVPKAPLSIPMVLTPVLTEEAAGVLRLPAGPMPVLMVTQVTPRMVAFTVTLIWVLQPVVLQMLLDLVMVTSVQPVVEYILPDMILVLQAASAGVQENTVMLMPVLLLLVVQDMALLAVAGKPLAATLSLALILTDIVLALGPQLTVAQLMHLLARTAIRTATSMAAVTVPNMVKPTVPLMLAVLVTVAILLMVVELVPLDPLMILWQEVLL